VPTTSLRYLWPTQPLMVAATSSIAPDDRFVIQGFDGTLWRFIPAMVRTVPGNTTYLDFGRSVIPEIRSMPSRAAFQADSSHVAVADSASERLTISLF